MTTKNNTPAFPVPSYVNASGETHDSAQSGMTLRQWYAGMAMQGAYRMHMEGTRNVDRDSASLASEAFAIADAMLAHESAPASAKDGE